MKQWLLTLYLSVALFNTLQAQPMLKAQIGEGVWLLTKDSLFSMNIRPRVQLRALSSNEVRQTEFEEEIFARRMRLWTAGHLFSPKLTYLFQLHFVEFDVLPQRIEETDFNRRPIRDLIVQYNLSPATWISFGQTKLPAHRSRIISSLRLQIIERGIDHALFDVDRDIGFQARTQVQAGNEAFWRLTLALTTGEGRNQPPDWRGLSYAFRWEWLPFGTFKNGGDYVESDVFREETFKLALATSYIFNHNAIRSSSQIGFRLFEPTDIHTAIVDMLAKYRGASLEVEILYRDAKSPVQIDAENRRRLIYNGIGGHLQLGYIFENKFEVAGRIAIAEPESRLKPVAFAQREATLCIGKILVLPSIKFQADLTLAERRFWNGNPAQSFTMFRGQLELGI
jgi:phosphate-selective porin OprO/OprP